MFGHNNNIFQNPWKLQYSKKLRRYLGWDGRVFRRYLGRDGRVFGGISTRTEEFLEVSRPGRNSEKTDVFDLLIAHNNRDRGGHVGVMGLKIDWLEKLLPLKTFPSRPGYLLNISLDYPFKQKTWIFLTLLKKYVKIKFVYIVHSLKEYYKLFETFYGFSNITWFSYLWHPFIIVACNDSPPAAQQNPGSMLSRTLPAWRHRSKSFLHTHIVFYITPASIIDI